MTQNEAAEPVLVYDRIANNRRKTWLLVACALAALAPFVLGISYAVAGIAVRVSPEARIALLAARRRQANLERLRSEGQPRTEWDLHLENRIAASKAEADELERENLALRVKLMMLAAGASIAALSVLFCGIASSPTSKLLVQAGAQPAGEGEAEARRLLENLAIGAGLPAPKLYVIETSTPNAFAAGLHADHAVVAITRGALRLFDRRELEGVFAHELSHIGNHDIRLNTVVATISLFLRIPYLLFRRDLAGGPANASRQRGLGMWRFAVSPFGLYIFFVAPVVAALIRAAVSREREFLADADAALLTRYPEGLLLALAKIGGAGSSVTGSNPAFAHFYFADPVGASAGWFSRRLMSTHPPLAERIERLLSYQGSGAIAALERAIEDGRRFKTQNSVVELDPALGPRADDELAAFNQGNVMGRVYRVTSTQSVAVYENASAQSCRAAVVEPGELIVAFDDPGVMRQVNTANQTFGYLERGARLTPVEDLIPAEVYDPAMRAAAEARLAASSSSGSALCSRQIGIVVAFGVAVFAAILLLLIKLGG